MMPSFSAMVDLADKLDVFQAIKEKLLRQPDAAAERLVVVLEELSKIYIAIESELVDYLSLYFEDEGVKAERVALLRLEGGQISTRIDEARGHCHKIANIYHRFLDPWFQRILSRGELDTLRNLFDLLASSDECMVRELDKVAIWLGQQASITLNFVNAKKYSEANNQVCEARKEILPVRQAISKAMSELRRLQADFIGVSGVT